MLALVTPLTPVVVTLKLLAVTPVTALPKTAAKLTDAALLYWPVQQRGVC